MKEKDFRERFEKIADELEKLIEEYDGKTNILITGILFNITDSKTYNGVISLIKGDSRILSILAELNRIETHKTVPIYNPYMNPIPDEIMGLFVKENVSKKDASKHPEKTENENRKSK